MHVHVHVHVIDIDSKQTNLIIFVPTNPYSSAPYGVHHTTSNVTAPRLHALLSPDYLLQPHNPCMYQSLEGQIQVLKTSRDMASIRHHSESSDQCCGRSAQLYRRLQPDLLLLPRPPLDLFELLLRHSVAGGKVPCDISVSLDFVIDSSQTHQQ